ncbi:hypothetical protein CNR22_14725 [Sphingobacteriaceae bacterium]|nr:hypothetical protein CNR22_14725 [Sphingobacteriaceae bacterium]
MRLFTKRNTMNYLIFFFSFLTAFLFFSCSKSAKNSDQLINPVLGDVSFMKKFGHPPSATTDEDLRIKTHFEYVEGFLRQKDKSHLSPALQQKREHILELLHTYWTTGIFPRNYDYADKRVPCFIDKNGNICGVGYLVEHTAGRKEAEKINGKHQYKKILEMNDKSIDEWIAANGLTKEECAMIQPTYGPTPTYNYNYISPSYGISSALLGGVNLSLNTMNTIQISTKTKKKTVPVLSLFTGASSIVLGLANMPQEKQYSTAFSNTNESKKNLSLLNIGFGTTTFIMGICNLVTNRKKSEKSVAWTIYNFRSPNNQPGFALSLTKKL